MGEFKSSDKDNGHESLSFVKLRYYSVGSNKGPGGENECGRKRLLFRESHQL